MWLLVYQSTNFFRTSCPTWKLDPAAWKTGLHIFPPAALMMHTTLNAAEEATGMDRLNVPHRR